MCAGHAGMQGAAKGEEHGDGKGRVLDAGCLMLTTRFVMRQTLTPLQALSLAHDIACSKAG